MKNNGNNIEYGSFKYSLESLQKGITVNTQGRMIDYRLNQKYKKYLPRKKLHFIELGCAPGGWMIYFKREFGYDVSGIDFSEEGIAVAKENMRLNNVKADLRCIDVQKLKERNHYDVVFSRGLIEHFRDYEKIFRIHYEIAKKGGYIVMDVPNYYGFNKFMLHLFNRDYVRMHNFQITNLMAMRQLVRKFKLKTLFLDVVGTFGLDIYGLKFLQHPDRHHLDCIVHQSITNMLKNVKFESRYTSPVVLFIGRKI